MVEQLNIEETRKDLLNFMQKANKTQHQISKETGLSSSVISQYVNSSYTGDNKEVSRAIKKYLKIAKERENKNDDTRFYSKLYNTQQVFFATTYAHTNSDIALISGDAGAGKTTALKQYRNDNTGVIFITANSCCVSATAVLNLILEQLGKNKQYKRSEIMLTLISLLKGTNKLIIIDEADHLTLGALQAIRNLNDEANVGIVLSGNDKIYRQMFSGRRGYEFDQIRTRIVVRKKVVNSYTVEEIQNIFPNENMDCIAYLLKLACKESLRTAKKIHSIALDYASSKNQATLTMKDLKKIQNDLLGEFI